MDISNYEGETVMRIGKKAMPIMLLIFLMASILMFGHMMSSTVYANDISVTYQKQESDRFEVRITAKGNGEVKLGSFRVRNSEDVYMLPIDEEADFKVSPDRNSRVKSIMINGSEQKISDSINVKGMERSQTLHVEFADSSMPKTGDGTELWIYLAMLIGAAAWTYYLVRKSKKE